LWRLPADQFGRQIDYLRISVTDHCNLRCVYCMPLQGLTFVPSASLLTAAEIETVVRAAVDIGFRKFRLTGGEPTLRADVVEIVERLAAVPGVEDLAMTTNAVRLPALAKPLARAGLQRVNVHVDTLDPEHLSRVMRWGSLDTLLAGLAAAVEAGFAPLKLNCVVTRGFNDEDVVELAEYALARGWHVRFIELMPLGVGETAAVARRQFVSSAETRARLKAHFGPLTPLTDGEASDASRNFGVAGRGGVLGFISPVSEPYCGNCNRMRLTADGHLHLCLLRDEELDAATILRNGGGLDALRTILRAAVAQKPTGHQLIEARSVERREMFQIGG
jgi:cyclic pyranopterin phosphate synthase